MKNFLLLTIISLLITMPAFAYEKHIFCRSGKPLYQKYVYPGLFTAEDLCKRRGVQL